MNCNRNLPHFLLLLFSWLLPNAVWAEVDGITGAEPDTSPPGWLLPAPKIQLEMDADLVPIGKGAIFVPAMSDSASEPAVIVSNQADEVVARSPTGKKIIVPPGRYKVKVGSGVEGQMITHHLEIYEGHVSMIKVNWAGLIVRVVDHHGAQIRGSYEIFALPTGEDFGLGLGADETRGERIRSWLLRPGRYMIVRSGETPRARTDFLTVRLIKGELVHFTLVQDENDGKFKGGGVVDRWEGRTEIENWRIGLIVGGDLLWNRNDHVPGRASGNSTTFNSFVNTSIRYLDPNHLIYLHLQIDEGGQVTQDIGEGISSLIKTIDEVDLDAIYTFRLLSWFGPYVRMGLNTNLFPGYRRFEEPSKVIVLNSDLEKVHTHLDLDEIRLADSLDPLEVKEGVGVSFDLSPSLLVDLHLRMGFGARHTWVSSLLLERVTEPEIAECQDSLCLIQASSSHLLGAEATLIGSARLSRWILFDTELDTLIPFVSSENSTDPVFNWKNTISLRLVSFASIAYVLKLDYNKQLSEFVQFEQRLLLRFTFDIL